MSASLSPPAGTSRERTWNALHTAAVEALPGAFRLMGVAEADIEDLLQEVLLAAYRSLDRFDPTWCPPQDDADPAGRDAWRQHRSAEARWVFGIAWRKVSHYLDRAHRRREVPSGLLPAPRGEPVDPAPLSEQRAVERERLELVIDVLWTLAPERRLLLVLHEAYEVPLVEIARELGINYNTATNRLRLAREDYHAAIQRLRPEQRDALRGCWLGFPLASAFLVYEDAGAIAPAPPEAPPPEAASPAPLSPEASPPALAPPLSAPLALAPPAPAPAGLAGAPAPAGLAGPHTWLGELGRAVGWSVAGAGGTVALLIVFAPPQPLWADHFGVLATELPRVRLSRDVEMAPEERPAPPPSAPPPDVTSRRDVAPRPAAPAPAQGDSFAEEYRVLDTAQAMLSAGDSAGALRQLALHEQRFPSGRLRSVRERLRELVQMRRTGPAGGAAREEPSR
ncbi:RNA polymerase sigma factor [Sorangium sp. So ce887]|uniref:RNA polymerase sigma factor n=1 Tax=Sorangium sp. So ce887 TaxID=3133324 RepID=UPI003F614ADC